MGVVSTKELARTAEREVGRPMIAKRRFVCVLDDDTTSSNPTTEIAILAAVFGTTEQALSSSTVFGQQHPTMSWWRLRKIAINEGYEGSPYHVEVLLEYGIVRDEEMLSPTNRPTIWSADGELGEYPATAYYYGSGNNTTYPLTNSAFDFYPGLMATEGTYKNTLVKNFENYPSSWSQAINHVNSDSYWGWGPHQLKVTSVDATQEYEEWGGTVRKYWKATATIVGRQSGHNLLLPDVGYNFIGGGEKRRAMVFDFNNGEWVPSPNPIGLNGSGAPSPTGNPAILNRRVNPETNFAALFGVPPT